MEMILFLDSLAMYIVVLLVTFSNVRLYYSLVKLAVDVISTGVFNISNPAGIYDLGSFNHGSSDCNSTFTLKEGMNSF